MVSRCLNFRRLLTAAIFTVVSALIFLTLTIRIPAQDDSETVASVSAEVPSRLRVGEKLSYNISFSRFLNAGHAELFVVSRGKIGATEAVEIRSRIKTFDLVSAAFFLVDESRTIYVAPDSVLPVYLSKISHLGPIPKESIANYLTLPASNFDIVSLIYKARESGGVGTYPVLENDKVFTVTFQTTTSERLKTDAGEFDTTISTVQSEFLTAGGIKDFKINFSTDDAHVPVMLRFKTAKGEFRAVLSSLSLPEPPALPLPPTPTPTSTPAPAKKPTPVPDAYVDNKPLAPELGFQLGETLDYRVTYSSKPSGVITLKAGERKMFEKEDSLELSVTVTSIEPGSSTLNPGDNAMAQVDPETLAPQRTETRFVSPFIGLKQVLTFDKRTGGVSFGAEKPLDAPVGTHSIVSLIYAMRSFNLKPSKDPSNPVNDTRVAVFWESRPYIFTLRPSNAEEITINGEKVSAQLITITTDDKQLDGLAIKVWLSTEGRVPLRFSIGAYQAELITKTPNLIK